MAQGAMTAVRSPGSSPSTWYPSALVAFFGWTFVGTLSYARHFVQVPGRVFDVHVVPEYLAWLTCYAPWVALTPLVFRMERRFPLGQAGWLGHAAVLAAASLPFTYVASLLTLCIGFVVRTLFGLPAVLPDPIGAARELLGHGFLYWTSVGASWLLRALFKARENERHAARLVLEKSQLETSLRQAELDALRSRLDPHFLFNSLQNISVLMQHDADTGARMLARLGDVLRASLRRDAHPETTLKAEIALTKAYLAVEQMRFGDRLSSRVELEEGTEEALVPTFLLQPLVENAIRHGLDPKREGLIVIRSWLGFRLELSVTDNGAGPPAEPLSQSDFGIGLGATCERLALMYPGSHTFAMRAGPAGGTEIHITIPLRFATETQNDATAAAADRR